MKDMDAAREQISLLADGVIPNGEVGTLVAKICADEALLSTWRAYHVAGDVLRAGVHQPCTDSARFVGALRERLATEARTPASVAPAQATPNTAALQSSTAANEPVFRWKLVAGAASVVAAVAIGWSGVSLMAPATGPSQLAQAPQVPFSTAEQLQAGASPSDAAVASLTTSTTGRRAAPTVMLRDPRLDQLLEAHQQTAGGSRMPSGFLRNATFDGPAR